MSEPHNDWRVVHGGADLLIEGPGQLKLVLRSFSPAKIEHPSGASAQGAELAAQCTWQYPAAHLAAQLPLLVRGFYYESWSPAYTPVKARHQADFLAPLREHFKNDPSVNAEELAGGAIGGITPQPRQYRPHGYNPTTALAKWCHAGADPTWRVRPCPG